MSDTSEEAGFFITVADLRKHLEYCNDEARIFVEDTEGNKLSISRIKITRHRATILVMPEAGRPWLDHDT